MKRDVDYLWHLAGLMARRGLHNSTELAPLLRERGIDLSPSQVYRLVTGRPERVSLKVVAALCDVFECGIDDLITTTAADAKKTRRTGTESSTIASWVAPASARSNAATIPVRSRPARQWNRTPPGSACAMARTASAARSGWRSSSGL